MKIKDKLISNTIYLSLDWFFIALFSMLFWLIVGKTLSPESYGIIATSTQLSLLLTPLAVLGLGFSSSKLISELLEKGLKDEVQGVINYSLKIVTFTSIGLVLILIIFSPHLSSYLKLEPKVILLTSFIMFFSSISAILGSFYYGFQKMKKFFLTNFIGHLIKVIVPLILIFMGFGLFGPLIGLVICYFLIFLTRIDKHFFNVSKKVKIDKKKILGFSKPSFTTDIFSILFDKTKYIILTFMKSLETTGFFAIAGTVSLFLQNIPNILSMALFPIISGLDVDKNKTIRRNYLMRLVFRYSLFIILPIGVFLILFSEYVILLFSSPEYLPGAMFLPFLTIGGIFMGLSNLSSHCLFAIGKPKIQRNIQIVSTLIYFSLALPLTFYFSGMGLAIAYLITTLVIFFLGFIFMKKFLDFSLPFKDIGRIILALFFSTLFLTLLRSHVKNFLMAVVFAGTAILIYFLVLLKLNFYLKEDLKVLDFLSDRSPIFKNWIKTLRNYLSKFVKRSYK